MSGHTPGPWTVDIPSDWPGRQETSVRAAGWGQVALCAVDYSLPHCVEQQKANARLIAAAPDLLEACKAIVEYQRLIESDETTGLIEAYGNAFEGAVAAIARAQGVQS